MELVIRISRIWIVLPKMGERGRGRERGRRGRREGGREEEGRKEEERWMYLNGVYGRRRQDKFNNIMFEMCRVGY